MALKEENRALVKARAPASARASPPTPSWAASTAFAACSAPPGCSPHSCSRSSPGACSTTGPTPARPPGTAPPTSARCSRRRLPARSSARRRRPVASAGGGTGVMMHEYRRARGRGGGQGGRGARRRRGGGGRGGGPARGRAPGRVRGRPGAHRRPVRRGGRGEEEAAGPLQRRQLSGRPGRPRVQEETPWPPWLMSRLHCSGMAGGHALMPEQEGPWWLPSCVPSFFLECLFCCFFSVVAMTVLGHV